MRVLCNRKPASQASLDAGYSPEDALEAAKDWVALPGTSEHQLGLAVDINADVTLSTSEEVYDWFAKHAHEYGFILRYPEGKEDITGISYEPWHFRYVGLEAAQEIYAQGLCLEEYIQKNYPQKAGSFLVTVSSILLCTLLQSAHICGRAQNRRRWCPPLAGPSQTGSRLPPRKHP